MRRKGRRREEEGGGALEARLDAGLESKLAAWLTDQLDLLYYTIRYDTTLYYSILYDTGLG